MKVKSSNNTFSLILLLAIINTILNNVSEAWIFACFVQQFKCMPNVLLDKIMFTFMVAEDLHAGLSVWIIRRLEAQLFYSCQHKTHIIQH